jgi:hypothetical protein
VIVPEPSIDVPFVFTVKFTDVAPAATVTDAGTVALL